MIIAQYCIVTYSRIILNYNDDYLLACLIFLCLIDADVNLAPWSETPDENGVKTRFISYTLSINYSIGPKSSPSSELQASF